MGMIEAALQSENYGGWNRYVFLLLFLYGCVIVQDTRLGHTIRQHGPVALALALPATVLGFTMYVRAAQAGIYLGHGYALQAVLWRLFKGAGAWWWIIALLGLGGAQLQAHADGQRHRDSSSQVFLQRAVRYANEAVLPFYVLHHPVVVAIGFYVVRWETSLWVKYLITSSASLMATFVVYELAIKRISFMRFLFGMRRREEM
jgi:glucan biosynthesis protein C